MKLPIFEKGGAYVYKGVNSVLAGYLADWKPTYGNHWGNTSINADGYRGNVIANIHTHQDPDFIENRGFSMVGGDWGFAAGLRGVPIFMINLAGDLKGMVSNSIGKITHLNLGSSNRDDLLNGRFDIRKWYNKQKK